MLIDSQTSAQNALDKQNDLDNFARMLGGNREAASALLANPGVLSRLGDLSDQNTRKVLGERLTILRRAHSLSVKQFEALKPVQVTLHGIQDHQPRREAINVFETLSAALGGCVTHLAELIALDEAALAAISQVPTPKGVTE